MDKQELLNKKSELEKELNLTVSKEYSAADMDRGTRKYHIFAGTLRAKSFKKPMRKLARRRINDKQIKKFGTKRGKK